MVTILSIDGGGIRGLLPARVLAEIRRRLGAAGIDMPFSALFDLVAGTSTGAIIALALSLRNGDGTARFSLDQIAELYVRRGREIFPPSFRSILHAVLQAFRHKYPVRPFEQLLAETFGDATLRNAATNLLITSFDTEAMQPHCMKKRPAVGEWAEDPDYYMRDVARASAAAPTYFAPARVGPVGKKGTKYSLIDGAVFANNPSGISFVEATKIFPDESEFFILSLGTGDLERGYTYEEVHSWGYMEWVNPLKSFPMGAIMSAGQSKAVNHQLQRMSGVQYHRLNVSLNGCSAAMDDAGPRNLACLDALAERMIREHEEDIEAVCRVLTERVAALPSDEQGGGAEHVVSPD